MAILELHGFKVLPLPDLDDGESFVDWPGGGATTAMRWGGVLAGATDGGGKLLYRWSLALRGRFLTVSAGRQKTAINQSGIDWTVPK